MPNKLLFIQNLAPLEVLVILVIILLLFGSSQIPKLIKSIGEGIKEFKKAKYETEDKEEKKDKDKKD